MSTDYKGKYKGIQLGWQKASVERPAPGFLPHNTPQKKAPTKPWLLTDDESHLVTIAPTGFGKGRSVIIPTCLEYPGSMLVIDPKGEAATVTARRRRELGNEVVVIDPFSITSEPAATFNPFDVHAQTDMSDEEFSLLIPTLLHPDANFNSHYERFWDTRGDELISGVTAYLLSAAPAQDRGLTGLRKQLKNRDVVYHLATVLDNSGEEMSPMAYENISSIISIEDRCRSGILATAQQHFSIFTDPKVEKSLSETSFDLSAFKEGRPMTIYLVLPVTRLHTHTALLRLWTSSLLSLIKSRTQRPEISTLLMIDEAAQLGRLAPLVECLTLLRGYGVRTWTFWQSQNQLSNLYGEDADVILDNCGVLQCLGCNNLRSAKAMCELISPDYTPQDLLTLPRDQQLVITPDGSIERTHQLDYLRDRKYRSKYSPNPMYQLSGRPTAGKRARAS